MAELSVRARGTWGNDVVSKQQARVMVDELEALDRDVTALLAEHVAAGDAAEREQARYRELFALAPDPYLVTDDSGLLVEANRAAATLLGLEHVPAARQPLSQHVAPGDRHRFRARVGRLRQQGGGHRWEMEVGPVDGPWTPTAVHVTPVRDARGLVAGFRWLLRDVTRERRERDALDAARAADEATATRLQSLLDLHDVVVRGLAHDARTPLATVIGLAQLLRRDRDAFSSDRLEWALAAMYDNGRRVDHLLSDLVEVHQLSAGRRDGPRRATDLRAAAERAVTVCDLGSRTVRVEGGPVKVAAPPGVVERIVVTLLDNVRQHTPDETTALVEVRRESAAGVLVVADDGPGVPPESHDLVFEAFRRAPTARETAGAGIGLYVVAKLAELHGGEVWVEGSPLGGAAFAVRLPTS